mmetsp:Transcript_10769/g.66462  ORF Transcript_10769/g.66462 Transcript_10769/m.66462 type:complete len:220 (+) Transcript_10769:1680-2339(+)
MSHLVSLRRSSWSRLDRSWAAAEFESGTCFDPRCVSKDIRRQCFVGRISCLCFVDIRPNSPDAHSFFDVRGRHSVSESHDELGDLFDVDNVLGFVRVGVDDLRASRDLQRLFFLHGLFVRDQVPLAWCCESCVGFLDSAQIVDPLCFVFEFLFDRSYGFCVGSESVGFEQLDVVFVQGSYLFLLFSFFPRFGDRRHGCLFSTTSETRPSANHHHVSGVS